MNALAKRSGVDRNALTRIEAGESRAQDATLAKLDRTLTDLEEAMGIDGDEPAPSPGSLVTFEIEGVYGAKKVTVSGPVENLAELKATVESILRGSAE